MNQKGFANIILVVVIVMLVGAVGYFAFVKKSEPVAQQPTPTPTQVTNTPKSSPTPTTTPADPTANWKTYTNTQHGIEFKYPNNWEIDAADTNKGQADSFLDVHLTNYKVADRADCSKFIGMEIQAFHPIEGSFDTFVKSQVNTGGMGPSGNLTPIIIGGHTAYKVDNSGWDGGCGGPGYFIKASSTKYMYIFSGRGKETDQKIIDQILATFKFTN